MTPVCMCCGQMRTTNSGVALRNPIAKPAFKRLFQNMRIRLKNLFIKKSIPRSQRLNARSYPAGSGMIYIYTMLECSLDIPTYPLHMNSSQRYIPHCMCICVYMYVYIRLWLLMDPEFWGQPQSDNIDLDKPGPSNNSNEMTAHILRRPLWWQDDSPDSKSSSSDSTTLSVQAPTTSSSSSSSNASSFTGVADALVDVGSSSTEPAMTEGKAADVDMN